jgi:hypothetical protein
LSCRTPFAHSFSGQNARTIFTRRITIEGRRECPNALDVALFDAQSNFSSSYYFCAFENNIATFDRATNEEMAVLINKPAFSLPCLCQAVRAPSFCFVNSSAIPHPYFGTFETNFIVSHVTNEWKTTSSQLTVCTCQAFFSIMSRLVSLLISCCNGQRTLFPVHQSKARCLPFVRASVTIFDVSHNSRRKKWQHRHNRPSTVDRRHSRAKT